MNERRGPGPADGEKFQEASESEIEAEIDPGLESDEDIDGEVDAEGGSALKRRNT